MSVLIRQVDPDGSVEKLLFECPACGCFHAAWIKNKPDRPVWMWDGNMDRPTFAPSIRVAIPCENGHQVCHFHVREGRIRYCNDSTHHLAGYVVNMVEF